MLNTTLCYIERGDEWLLLHRVKKVNDINHDKWIGLGGKFLPGETPEQCVLREVREETGLRLTQWRYCGVITFHSTQWPSEQIHLYHATYFDGTPGACDEGELVWVDKRRLQELPAGDGDTIFLTLMERGGPFFELELRYDGDRLCAAVLDGRALPLPGWEAAL